MDWVLISDAKVSPFGTTNKELYQKDLLVV